MQNFMCAYARTKYTPSSACFIIALLCVSILRFHVRNLFFFLHQIGYKFFKKRYELNLDGYEYVFILIASTKISHLTWYIIFVSNFVYVLLFMLCIYVYRCSFRLVFELWYDAHLDLFVNCDWNHCCKSYFQR